MLAAALALLKPFGLLLRKVPWWVWVALGLAIAFVLWLHRHDAALVKKTTADVNATWEAKEKKAADDQVAAVNHLRGEIADWVLAYLAKNTALAAEITARVNDQNAAFDALAKQRSTNVTPQAIARCALTRGVILQFNAGSDAANGTPDAPREAEPAGISRDTPAGVSLDTYARAVELVQAGLGTCREQVLGWQRYCGPGGELDTWYEGIRKMVDRCFPAVGAPVDGIHGVLNSTAPKGTP